MPAVRPSVRNNKLERSTSRCACGVFRLGARGRKGDGWSLPAQGLGFNAKGVMIRQRARVILAWCIPLAITVGWAVYVVVAGQMSRVARHWASTVTMIFGSFVAGSTPQGGGAIAFPVFTKVLNVGAAPARTFSLTIQAIGMVVAAASILLVGRRVDRRAVLLAGGTGVVGFLAGVMLLGRLQDPFLTAIVPAPYVKVTFTIALAAMSLGVVRTMRWGQFGQQHVPWRPRTAAIIVAVGLVGGLASYLTGSGVDVGLFIVLVLGLGLHPRVGVPTSVVAMAAVSATGSLLLVFHGQLTVDINTAGDVIAIGGTAFDAALPAKQFDLFGLWLAAVPVVVWGAPLGTVFIARIPERQLVQFVAGMALLEVLTTAVFLRDLRTDIVLVVYALGGLALALWIVGRLRPPRPLAGERTAA